MIITECDLFGTDIYESPARYKLECYGGFSNFKAFLLIKTTIVVVQILHNLSYPLAKVYYIVLFILVLSISAIILQASCCYVVTT